MMPKIKDDDQELISKVISMSSVMSGDINKQTNQSHDKQLKRHLGGSSGHKIIRKMKTCNMDLSSGHLQKFVTSETRMDDMSDNSFLHSSAAGENIHFKSQINSSQKCENTAMKKLNRRIKTLSKYSNRQANLSKIEV